MFRELGVVDLFGVLDLGCAVHVLGGFCGREGCLGCVVHVLAGFCGRGGVLGCVVHVWAVSWLAGHGVLCGG